MKRLSVWCILFCFFFGCKSAQSDMDRALSVRQQLLKSEGCSFSAQITADYQDSMYVFHLKCASDEDGNVRFTVEEPESIQGISGVINSKNANLTFDDKVLAFPHLTDELISPVCAPWFFLRGLRSGFIDSTGVVDNQLKLSIEDSYIGNRLQLDTFFNENNQPIQCDFYWKGTRILSMVITNFVYK